MESPLSAKGQVTVIKFFVHPDGGLVILPKISTSELKGIVKARQTASLNDMDAAIAEGAIRRRRFASK